MLDIIEIRNGSKTKGTFSSTEMLGRMSRLRDVMNKKNIDAVVFTSIQNVNYYSDFLYCAFGRPYALVVTHERSITISANIDGGQPYRRSLGDNLVYTDWQKDNYYRAIQSVLNRVDHIGVEYDHLTLQGKEKMSAAFPDSQLIDINEDVMQLRMIKSSEEIALIKQGARIADIGGQACVDALSENVPEYEVALAANAAMTREIANTYTHVELRDTWTWFQSGLNTDGAHNPLTTKSVHKGDILSLNCFPMIAGYYTALERTLFLDHCNDEQLRVWEVNCEVHRKGIELIQPGARCSDIAAELNDIFAGENLLEYRTFGYGHSFGVLSHYYGREAGLELREDVDTILKPGMVVSMEPMLMLPEGSKAAGGYREHDILVIDDEGSENITHFPFGPEHNIVKI